MVMIVAGNIVSLLRTLMMVLMQVVTCLCCGYDCGYDDDCDCDCVHHQFQVLRLFHHGQVISILLRCVVCLRCFVLFCFVLFCFVLFCFVCVILF